MSDTNFESLLKNMNDEFRKNCVSLPPLSEVPGKSINKKIKSLIPNMVTMKNATHIAAQFIPNEDEGEKPIDPKDMYEKMMTINKWKRPYKEKDGNEISRMWTHDDFDDQLRLYVITNADDTEIVFYEFAAE